MTSSLYKVKRHRTARCLLVGTLIKQVNQVEQSVCFILNFSILYIINRDFAVPVKMPRPSKTSPSQCHQENMSVQ